MSAPFTAISAPRLNGMILLLCAMALASPLVEAVPGGSANLFWLSRAAGVTIALAAVGWPCVQRWALGGVALFLVLVPCGLQMHYRAWSGPATWCHDSVVQFEVAIRMVREKRNPYTEEFTDTALARWHDWEKNPALHHFVYPPMLLYLSLPVEAASRAVLWKMPEKADPIAPRFYDQRLVVVPFFLGLLGVVWYSLKEHPHRVGLTSLAALNPWLAPFVVEGRNDVAMLFWVAAAWIAYETSQRRYGHLLLGLAIATKTLLLPMIPFVAYAHRRDWKVCVPLLVAPLLFTSLPFFASDPRSFVDDLFLAPAGLGAHPFEIRGWGGLGFANLVLALHWVRSPEAYFPFSIFQALAFAVCLFYGLRSLKRNGSNELLFLWSALGIFVVLFFGRFIHDNYIGALVSIGVMSQTARETPPVANSTSSPG
ncbi:MAG TPA: hypothetical protein VKW04_06365 [Planctomycetota bacterium]|nr:hypothetical protein [Planctomycetota bacterium]